MIPIRSDRPIRQTPVVNYGLIIANALVFLATLSQIQLIDQMLYQRLPYEEVVARAPVFAFYLHPVDPAWYQFLSSQFLHGNWSHIIFNMVFLYVFGNNLEDRLGHLGYLAFYLAGGVIAGLGHCLLENLPVIGASGAVSAVTGAFLALFPRTRITILWIFFIITFFEIPSMYLILFSIGRDLFSHFFFPGGVAYLAHLSGNAFGFAVGMALLAVRVLPREPYDMLALVDRWHRRQQLRSATRGGYSPWEHDPASARRAVEREPTEEEQRLMQSRAEVTAALEAQDSARALDTYERLLEIDASQSLHREAQLDVANLAMNEQRYHTAARAYENFLRAFPGDSFADQVHLILGLIYARYLHTADQARPHLETAREKLTDPSRRQMADTLLAEIG